MEVIFQLPKIPYRCWLSFTDRSSLNLKYWNLRTAQKPWPCISQWARVKTCQPEEQWILSPWKKRQNAVVAQYCLYQKLSESKVPLKFQGHHLFFELSKIKLSIVFWSRLVAHTFCLPSQFGCTDKQSNCTVESGHITIVFFIFSPLGCSHLTYNMARALSLWQTSQGNSLQRGMEGA